jgi:hypothetical protein
VHAPKAEQAKKAQGIAIAESNNKRELQLARDCAERLARASRYGTTDADEVRATLEAEGHTLVWGNWAGAIFRGPRWSRQGDKASTHEGGHGRRVGVWRRIYG